MTLCPKCGVNPRVVYPSRSRAQGYCKQCWSDRANAWNKKNRDRVKDLKLRRNFKTTLVEYRKLEVAQGGVCAICYELCSTGWDLAQDHNHKTQKNRGLLCGNCNRGIGCLQESPAILHRAIEYLNQWKLIHAQEQDVSQAE